MASDITVKIAAGDDLAKKFTDAAGAAHEAIRRELGHGLVDLALAMKTKIRSNLRQRSGDLLRSIIVEEIRDSGTEMSGRAGSNLEYAEIQERGGQIRAKNVSNLTIPLEPFLTGQSIARGTARQVISSPGQFGYDGTFFSRGVLMGKRGEESEPLFALKPSVTIPAHPYAEPAIEEVRPGIEASMRAALEALL